MEWNVETLKIYSLVALVALLAACIRYLLMTGTYYIIVCRVFDRWFHKYKINPERGLRGHRAVRNGLGVTQ